MQHVSILRIYLLRQLKINIAGKTNSINVIQMKYIIPSSAYEYKKITDGYACSVTENSFDLIGGLQRDDVSHEECRGNCTKYSWCHGVRIVYDGTVAGRRKKRGVHSEQCRLLTPNSTVTLDGWSHLNKDNWAKVSDWKKSFYDGFNCYQKAEIGK